MIYFFVNFIVSPIIKKPRATKLNITENERRVRISCDAVGYPSPQITWTKDGRKIGSDERTFEIDHVDPSDQGVYTCTASNGIPPSAYKSFRITVFCKYNLPVLNNVFETIVHASFSKFITLN